MNRHVVFEKIASIPIFSTPTIDTKLKRKALMEKIVTRYGHLQKTLIWLTIFSFAIIVLGTTYQEMDGKLKRFVGLFEILQRLSFSYLSAFIFYLIVTFLPKERKKAKFFLHISNSIAWIHIEVTGLQETLSTYAKCDKEYGNYSHKEFEEIMSNTSSRNKVISFEGVVFPNWDAYFSWKISNLDKLIRNLLPYYDLMNGDTIYLLTTLNHHIYSYQHGSRWNLGSPNLQSVYFTAYDFPNYVRQLSKSHSYHRDYNWQNHFNYKKATESAPSSNKQK